MSFHVRRKDKNITDERLLKKILKTSKYVTIALSMDNQPYLVSLTHGYDEEHNCVYFHCAKEGKKLHYLKSNKNTWGQALLDCGISEGQGECTYLYASVHFSGKVTLIENLEEKLRGIRFLMDRLDGGSENHMANVSLDRLKNTVIGRIDIEYMSGKKSKEVTI
jgi:hypothetical protein